MTQFNFSSAYNEAAKQYNLGEGGGKYTIEEGQNRFRLVSICLPHPSVYKNGDKITNTFKWLCHVIDRRDGKVKPYFMPSTVYKGIEALQMSEDYKFDGVPMPYDCIVVAKNAGTKEVQYTTLPAKESPLTPAEIQMIKDAPTIQEIQTKIYEKTGKPTANHVDLPPDYVDLPPDYNPAAQPEY